MGLQPHLFAVDSDHGRGRDRLRSLAQGRIEGLGAHPDPGQQHREARVGGWRQHRPCRQPGLQEHRPSPLRCTAPATLHPSWCSPRSVQSRIPGCDTRCCWQRGQSLRGSGPKHAIDLVDLEVARSGLTGSGATQNTASLYHPRRQGGIDRSRLDRIEHRSNWIRGASDIRDRRFVYLRLGGVHSVSAENQPCCG